MSFFLRFLTLSFLLAVASAFMPVHTVAPSRQASTKVYSASTLERSPEVLNGPTIIEEHPTTTHRKSTEEPTRDRRRQGNEAWEVRIYNDGLNTREHVARSLVQVTGLSEMLAYQTMMHAHQNGIAVVGRWAFEVAEMYHEELKKNGIVCDIVPVDEDQ
jgi:ATP-dependent Clp protease adapter protein ClpS